MGSRVINRDRGTQKKVSNQMKNDNTEMTYTALLEAAMTSGQTVKKTLDDLGTLLKLRAIIKEKKHIQEKEQRAREEEAWSKVEQSLAKIQDAMSDLKTSTLKSLDILEKKIASSTNTRHECVRLLKGKKKGGAR